MKKQENTRQGGNGKEPHSQGCAIGFEKFLHGSEQSRYLRNMFFYTILVTAVCLAKNEIVTHCNLSKMKAKNE